MDSNIRNPRFARNVYETLMKHQSEGGGSFVYMYMVYGIGIWIIQRKLIKNKKSELNYDYLSEFHF